MAARFEGLLVRLDRGFVAIRVLLDLGIELREIDARRARGLGEVVAFVPADDAAVEDDAADLVDEGEAAAPFGGGDPQAGA